MRIALDAMGGDYAPETVVSGAVEAVHKLDKLEVTLVGDQEQILPALGENKDHPHLDIFHCSEVVEMNERPGILRSWGNGGQGGERVGVGVVWAPALADLVHERCHQPVAELEQAVARWVAEVAAGLGAATRPVCTTAAGSRRSLSSFGLI